MKKRICVVEFICSNRENYLDNEIKMVSFKFKIILAVLFLFLTSFLLYKDTLYNGFVFDDVPQVVENKWIRSFNDISKIFSSGVWNFREFHEEDGFWYRPMMHIFLMIEYHFFKSSSLGYHLVNIVFHSINAILFFLLIMVFFEKNNLADQNQELRGGKFTLALVAAFIFSIHPINSEVVNWISAIPELSFTLFFISAFGFYLLSDKGFIYPFLSVISFSLALLCKETALTFPLFMLAYKFFVEERVGTGKRWEKLWTCLREIWPYISVSVGYLFIRYAVLGFDSFTNINGRYLDFIVVELFIGIDILIKSILEIFYPFKLSILHAYDPYDLYVLPVCVILAMAASFLHLNFRRVVKIEINKVVLLGAGLFLIPLIPSLNYIFLSKFILSERYLYLPSMGFSLICAFFLLQFLGKIKNSHVKIIVILITAIFFVAFVLTVKKRNIVWKNNISLFSDAVEKFPKNDLAQLLLVEAYCKNGDIEKCTKQFLSYCDLENKNDYDGKGDCSGQEDYYKYLGDAYFKKGDFDSAINQYNLSLELSKSSAEVHMNLGLAYYQIGDLRNAQKCLESALKLDPRSASINSNLGLLHCKKDDMNRANHYFLIASRLSGQSREAIYGFKKCQALANGI